MSNVEQNAPVGQDRAAQAQPPTTPAGGDPELREAGPLVTWAITLFVAAAFLGFVWYDMAVTNGDDGSTVLGVAVLLVVLSLLVALAALRRQARTVELIARTVLTQRTGGHHLSRRDTRCEDCAVHQARTEGEPCAAP